MKHTELLTRDSMEFFTNAARTITLCDDALEEVFGRRLDHERHLELVISTKKILRSVPVKIHRITDRYCYQVSIGKWRLWDVKRYTLLSCNTAILNGELNPFINKNVYVTIT